jgi:hypothetical protein
MKGGYKMRELTQQKEATLLNIFPSADTLLTSSSQIITTYRNFVIACLLIVSLIAIGGCKCETSTSFGLSIEKASFARMEADGKLSLISDPVYKRGEPVYFVLLNVGEFKKGEDGLNRFDMDLEFKGPEDQNIFSKKGMLGEKGHVNLPNNTAASPYGVFSTTSGLKPGKYFMKLTIYDKIGEGSASKGSTLMLE